MTKPAAPKKKPATAGAKSEPEVLKLPAVGSPAPRFHARNDVN